MSKTKHIILGIIIGMGLMIPAGAYAHQIYDKTINVDQGSRGYISRWDDPDFQVKCWEYSSGYQGGLSCLPWSEAKER